MIILQDVLTDADVQDIRGQLDRVSFVDGKATAKGQAADRKQNLQAERDKAVVPKLEQRVIAALAAHPVFRSAVVPKRVMAPLFSRYEPGMEYGFHLDMPFMGSGNDTVRADLSVTVFLSAPDSYQGGELIVQTHAGDLTVKLDAGDAVVYFSGTRHRVMPVTAGQRLVAVTWVESRLRDPAQRDLIHDLTLGREQLRQREPDAAELELFDKVYVNLLRMWGDS